MKVLVTGGSGLLGSEIMSKRMDWVYPMHAEMDILDYVKINDMIDTHKPEKILHCAALTSPPVCELEKEKAAEINQTGTKILATACDFLGIPIVYISTDYVFDGKKKGGMYGEEDKKNPVNHYALTKLLGEMEIESHVKKYLIIRTSFCQKDQWPYQGAFVDKFSSLDTVDKIADEIILAVEHDVFGIVHIGTERKSFFELAKKMSPDVTEMHIKDVPFTVPKDTSLNVKKWEEIKQWFIRRKG